MVALFNAGILPPETAPQVADGGSGMDTLVLRELQHCTAHSLPILATALDREPVLILASLERLMKQGRVTSRKRSNGRVVYRSKR